MMCSLSNRCSLPTRKLLPLISLYPLLFMIPNAATVRLTWLAAHAASPPRRR
jgi:hypothetical protein